MKNLFCIMLLVWCYQVKAQPTDNLTIWDNKPGKDWMTEYYPIGNGRMGAMLSGGVVHDHIQFNELSLWTGDEKETGAYQAFGDVFLDLAHSSSEVKDYSRSLKLANAVHEVSYKLGGITFSRQSFANHPENVLVFKYLSNKKGAYSGKIKLTDAHNSSIAGDKDMLYFNGKLENNLQYAASLKIKYKGGSVKVIENEQKQPILVLDHVDSFTLYLVASTDYSPLREKGWRDGDPVVKNKEILHRIANKSDNQLMQVHMKDYLSLFGRLHLSIGQSTVDKEKTTLQQILDYKKTSNPNLETLLFQYGRYLLISSSRKGGLPANLQGIWNNSNNPPWRCDYHSNINVQMNYWPAEVSNLAECHIPYLDYIQSMREVKKVHTQEEFPGVRGWTVRTENNIFGGESFIWNMPGSAWYAQGLWEHYAFNQNKEYLKNFAHPILKEICEFWDDRLKRREDGTVVAPNGWSPEHGPTEDGVTYDQQIIYDLFTNYIESCDSLGIDQSYRDHIATLRQQLLKPKIGRWGQLQEWETDRDDPNNTHRHVSHLFALYPGREISINKTPELAKAARVSLAARGDESTGWSMAWKMNFWARLHDGNHAYTILHNFITLASAEGVDYDHGGGIYQNLLCSHPPFQIDGNLGYVAGVCEMLVQSHEGFIDLLPAIPDQWKSQGEVSGLRVRGNITLDMKWKDGQVLSYKLSCPERKKVRIKVNGVFNDIITRK